ncbi:helicase/secretion neighborhood TadE-like protein [Klenkia soli]|uniref:Helicase/secretion neighborhood TadE-like protein n=1 Tax=Klenkia soli TaxID=1052260 RepID=A0A1H0NEJ5_9ACTN|nr:Rv3654c family TadE-like protein [Klenkia soli]SDO90845.1 helicase/secretion neighborhood TadE-like protein [Klenkia soli]
MSGDRVRGADRGERGSATVWTVALAAVLALVGAATVLVGAAVVARHRAGAAADLAALAVAGRAVLGDPAACDTGRAVAQANGADLTSCTVGPDAVVAVEVAVPVQLGPVGVTQAAGRARAGPVPRGADP